mmetsp:Transcript_5045/g.9763  ORF Transcript_5045/g.9763 Transcript_5045/m.9763 type:complete len:203 (+) Transcript_5045:351-959(+)
MAIVPVRTFRNVPRRQVGPQIDHAPARRLVFRSGEHGPCRACASRHEEATLVPQSACSASLCLWASTVERHHAVTTFVECRVKPRSDSQNADGHGAGEVLQRSHPCGLSRAAEHHRRPGIACRNRDERRHEHAQRRRPSRGECAGCNAEPQITNASCDDPPQSVGFFANGHAIHIRRGVRRKKAQYTQCYQSEAHDCSSKLA